MTSGVLCRRLVKGNGGPGGIVRSYPVREHGRSRLSGPLNKCLLRTGRYLFSGPVPGKIM